MALPNLLDFHSAIRDVTIQHKLPLLFDSLMSDSQGLDQILELQMHLTLSGESKEPI